MAGWFAFDEMFKCPMAQTVTETIMPTVVTIAIENNLTNKSRLTNAIVELVMHCKKSEYRNHDLNEEKLAAIIAGEFYALSKFHQNVLRFKDQKDAWDWVLRYLSQRPLRITQIVTEAINKHETGLIVDGFITNPTISRSIIAFYYLVEAKGDPKLDIQALAYYTCSMVKRGIASRKWLRDKLSQIRHVLDDDVIEITDELISVAWNFYGVHYPPQDHHWPLLFAQIKTDCQKAGLTCLSEAANSTAYQGASTTLMIQEAMKVCSDFNWSLITDNPSFSFKVLNDEYAIFQQDLRDLDTNPWKMFNHRVEGRGRKLLNLGYLSKNLLIVKGITSVNYYAGLDNTPNAFISQKHFIDRVVKRYSDQIFARENNIFDNNSTD